MPKIKSIKDVVDWGLCTGCGACFSACKKDAISLINIENVGIRPKVNTDLCSSDCECLSICPGYEINGHMQTGIPKNAKESDVGFGPTLEIWEGYAADETIRYEASSGGVTTALALYCLHHENMEFVLHTAMDEKNPLYNKTVQSRNRQELLGRTGSRYSPGSPADGLKYIEESPNPAVFIGKPCDAAAVSKLAAIKPELQKNLGLILTFFCAGTPSTAGTLSLFDQLDVSKEEVQSLRYRGQGWPGNFSIKSESKENVPTFNYETSWSKLQSYRPFRCHLCPDGLGQVADISCGDGWHDYAGNGNDGLSIILIRTEKGRKIFHKAVDAGYIVAKLSNIDVVNLAQKNLLERRRHIFGRLLAMRMLGVAIPKFTNFHLFRSWLKISVYEKIISVLGTARRVLKRKLWKRKNPFKISSRID